MIEVPRLLYYGLLALPALVFIVGLVVGIHDGKIWGYRNAEDDLARLKKDLEKPLDTTRVMR